MGVFNKLFQSAVSPPALTKLPEPPPYKPLPISKVNFGNNQSARVSDPLFVGFTTTADPERTKLLTDEIAAPRTWRDSLKISTYIESKRATRLEAAGSLPITGRLADVYVCSRAGEVFSSGAKGPANSGRIAAEFAGWLNRSFPGGMRQAVRGDRSTYTLVGFDVHACMRMLLFEVMYWNIGKQPANRLVLLPEHWESEFLCDPYKTLVPSTMRDSISLDGLCAALHLPAHAKANAKAKAELARLIATDSFLTPTVEAFGSLHWDKK